MFSISRILFEKISIKIAFNYYPLGFYRTLIESIPIKNNSINIQRKKKKDFLGFCFSIKFFECNKLSHHFSKMSIQTLLDRRSIRAYDPTYEIPKDVLSKIVQAALNSPTALNRQDIDLVVCYMNNKYTLL